MELGALDELSLGLADCKVHPGVDHRVADLDDLTVEHSVGFVRRDCDMLVLADSWARPGRFCPDRPEIVDQLPDERVAWRTVTGDVRQRGVVTFLELDASHTRVNLAMEVETSGLAEKAADALGVVDRRARGDLRRFKHFIEERGSETGAWRGRVAPGG